GEGLGPERRRGLPGRARDAGELPTETGHEESRPCLAVDHLLCWLALWSVILRDSIQSRATNGLGKNIHSEEDSFPATPPAFGRVCLVRAPRPVRVGEPSQRQVPRDGARNGVAGGGDAGRCRSGGRRGAFIRTAKAAAGSDTRVHLHARLDGRHGGTTDAVGGADAKEAHGIPPEEAAEAGADGTETDADGGASAMLDELLSDVRDGDVHNEDGGDGGGGGGGPESVHRPATARPDGKALDKDASGRQFSGGVRRCPGRRGGTQDGGGELLDCCRRSCGLWSRRRWESPPSRSARPARSGRRVYPSSPLPRQCNCLTAGRPGTGDACCTTSSAAVTGAVAMRMEETLAAAKSWRRFTGPRLIARTGGESSALAKRRRFPDCTRKGGEPILGSVTSVSASPKCNNQQVTARETRYSWKRPVEVRNK
ncbi:hypothetical protein THAOC_35486, partial [Thalassiosira oceanica]